MVRNHYREFSRKMQPLYSFLTQKGRELLKKLPNYSPSLVIFRPI